jgi:hypothetical protein
LSHREQANRLRKALKEIRMQVETTLMTDRNPNRGDLMKVSRAANEALRATE